jgi:hypothetical protein
LLLGRKEKEALVIKLASEGKSYRYIAKPPYTQAFQMFQDNKSLPEVVVELDIDAPLCYRIL